MVFPFSGGNKFATETKRILKFNTYKQERERLEAEMDHIAAQTLEVISLMASGRISRPAGTKELTEYKVQMKVVIAKANKINAILNKLLRELTETDIKSISREK